MKKDFHFTLIEMITVIVIIGILAAIIIPYMKRARESGEEVYCLNSMRQIALANLQYAEDYEIFAPARHDLYSENVHRWHGRTESSNPATTYYNFRHSVLFGYLGNSSKTLQCPSLYKKMPKHLPGAEKNAGGFGYNELIAYTGERSSSDLSTVVGPPVKKILNPSAKVMFADAAAYCDSNGDFIWDNPNSLDAHLSERSIAASPYPLDRSSEAPVSGLATGGYSTPSIHFRHNGTANAVWLDGHGSNEDMQWSISSEWRDKGFGWFGPEDNTLFAPCAPFSP